MRCSACGADNPPGAKFCSSCGAPLSVACASCGHSNAPGSRFCNECGRALTTLARSSEPAPGRASAPPESYTPRHLAEKILASREALAGERKQVTVLFADVVGSTELIQGRDPEEAQRLLDGVVRVMMDAVHRFEGTVSRLMGDGLMAMFGAPVAHEDHAVRACYAALAMLEGVRVHAESARRTYGTTPAIRVGLSAGEVVVRTIRDDLHMDYTAMGQTVHLAARMEQLAEPGTAALTAETLALVEGYVRVCSLGSVPVKGLDGPVEVFRVLGAGSARTRLQAAATRGLTRFVGRDAELAALHDALDRAAAGHGQVVALVGEPGVGKSRLVWELTHSHRTEGWTILESGSVSYGKATSYLPVIDLLKGYCRIEPRDDARTIREKALGKLLNLDEGLQPALSPILALLDVETEDELWHGLDPAERRRQTLDAVKRLLLRESQEQPMLLVFEDVHWIDAETQALLDSMVESLPTARILLLVNYRPEYRHDWGSRGFYTQLRIDPLGNAGADALLAGLLGDDPSLPPLATLLTERTGGNPFFLEESVRSLVETGALVGERGAYRLPAPVAQVRIPATVQAVLAARIDRLPPAEKVLLQTAAVVGKDVPDAVLRLVAGRDDEELRRGLAALQAAEFLYEAMLFPELEYTFKHALTHEVAYGSLLQERKRQLHAALVDAIHGVYATRIEEQLERLVHHALRGERWEDAVRYCQEVGLRESRRSVYAAARERFEQALGALEHLPDTRERLELRYDLQVGLRAALAALLRLEESVEVAKAAIATAEELGDPDRLAKALGLPGGQLAVLGRPDEAIGFLSRAIAVAEAHGHELIAATARQNVGLAYGMGGQARRAVEPLERAVVVLDPTTPLSAFERTGINTYAPATARAYLARALAEVGELDRAYDLASEALAIAEQTGHTWTTAQAALSAISVYLKRGDSQQAGQVAGRLLEIATTANLSVRSWLLAHLALAHARQGCMDDAERCMDEWRGAPRAGSPPFVVISAIEAATLLGRYDEALEDIQGLLDRARRNRHPGWEAWALFLSAEVGRRGGSIPAHDTERAYRDALPLADQEEMRPLQARTRLGLGLILRDLGHADEARAELEAAAAMLREMGMAFWLPEAETALSQADGSVAG